MPPAAPAGNIVASVANAGKRGQPPFAGTARRVLRTNGDCPLFPAVLAKKPGNRILPARELKGDRFTAIGQLGVDVEYYIASPSDGKDTPRHTLRWGTDMFDWANKLKQPEFQDLPVLLEVPGADGHGPNADEVRKLRELHGRATT